MFPPKKSQGPPQGPPMGGPPDPMMGGMGPMMGGMGGGGPMMGPPPGPQIPIGGSLPPGGDPGGQATLGQSPLLMALANSLAHPGMIPGGDTSLAGLGQGDPSGGMAELLQLLALAGLGAGDLGGGGLLGGSGVEPDQGQPGLMAGY